MIDFIEHQLCLSLHPKNDIIIKAKQGLRFLGVEIFPRGRRLNKRNWRKARKRLEEKNVVSYSGLVRKHSKEKQIKEFHWTFFEKLSQVQVEV